MAPPARALGQIDTGTGRAERSRAAAPAVDEEAVVLLDERVHAVEVSGQHERRLRLARRENAGRHERAEHAAVAEAQRAGHLGEDVEGEGVAGVMELAVAFGIDSAQTAAGAGCLTHGVETSTGPPSMPMRWADTPTHA